MTPQEVVLTHLNMARKIAGKYAKHASHVPFDDLLEAAYYGLCQAATRGPNPKNSYVACRIRGEVIQVLRDANKHRTQSHCEDVADRRASQLDEIAEVCLTYLPEKLHPIFNLRYREHLTQEEISSQLGICLTSINQSLGNIIGILRLHRNEIADTIF